MQVFFIGNCEISYSLFMTFPRTENLLAKKEKTMYSLMCNDVLLQMMHRRDR